ncbi:unnamed protein product [Effrenium voratum]|nr:unnamed protein product [Effrenium voratum]
MFPDEKSAAPKAERRPAVSLNQLLSPPSAKASQSGGALTGNSPSGSAAASMSQQPQGFFPWGSSQAPMDPAMLAAMMVQAAMMKSSPPVPPMATMPFAGPCSQMAPGFRPPFGQMQGYPRLPTQPAVSDASEGSSPAVGQGFSDSLPPMRPPKPSIQAQRTANTYSMRSEVPPFVMLLDEGFCERMLSDTPRR